MAGTRRALHSATLRTIQRSLSRASASIRASGIVEGALTVSPFASTLSPTPRRPNRRTSTQSTCPSPSGRRSRLRETTSRGFITVRRDAAHLSLDPLLHLGVHAEDVAPCRRDRRADHHLHAAGVLAERVTRPVFARIVRHRQDGRAGTHREQRSADAVAPDLARSDARALGENRHPHSLREAPPALLHDLVARAVAAGAVDRDAADRVEAPADERQPEQLALDDPALRREAALHEERLPGRLVLGHRDHGIVRNVFPAFHLAGDGEAPFDPFEHHRRVVAGEEAARPPAEEPPERHEDAVHRRDGDPADEEGDRAQHAHAATRWRAASARLSKTCVLRGMPPSSRVRAPLPVSTRIGCAPTASAACRSFRLSPTTGTPFSSVWKRDAISSNMPVRGFRQPQDSAAVCGQKKSASMRPPWRKTISIILSLMALSVAMSNRPRPIPDWLVATAIRQPPWCRRAIASIEPGIGRHSAGDLMYWSLSKLITPSRSRMTSFKTTSGREPGDVGDAVHLEFHL